MEQTQTLLPDDVPFDPIAYATGAEGFDRGVTLEQLATMDALLAEEQEPREAILVEAMLAWRRSYMEGYLAAQRVARVRHGA